MAEVAKSLSGSEGSESGSKGYKGSEGAKGPESGFEGSDGGAYPFPPGELGGCPLAYHRRRTLAPVAPVALPSGDEVLLVTRYDDIREVHAGPHFSRNLRYPGAP